MRKKITYIFSILIFFAVVYLVGKTFLPYMFDQFRGVDRDYVKKIESIKEGMTEQEVIRIMGQPTTTITDPEIKETHGIYGGGKEYGKVIKNKNKVLVYHHGVDYIGHYFIDQEGKVWFINVGGT
jgi:hypothetical protein